MMAEWIVNIASTVIGGLIVLMTMWYKERMNKRAEVQSWFEETFIENGVNRSITTCDMFGQIAAGLALTVPVVEQGIGTPALLNHMSLWKDINENRLKEMKIPYSSFELVGEILDSNSFVAWMGMIESLFISRSYAVIVEYTKKIADTLQFLRERLYEKEIKKKSDVITFHEHDNIKEIVDALQSTLDIVTDSMLQ